jgi:hypothetical protein
MFERENMGTALRDLTPRGADNLTVALVGAQ